MWQDRSEVTGLDDGNSGGVTWALAPGVQYITKRFVFEAAIQIPLVQNFHGSALENDYTATLSTRINFC